MKKTAALIVIAVFALYAWENLGLREHFEGPTRSGESAIAAAYQNQQSDLQVQGSGTVVRVLPDDNEGSRHQRFILELETGQTLLVSHNIDLAPRVASLKRGDTVEFFGEYEWNARGGVIHWTHHDPRGRHVGGWLRHKGRTYQ